MQRKLSLVAALLLAASPALAQNPPINLANWTTEQINGTAPWVVDAPRQFCSATNLTITDSSVLYSDFTMPGFLEFRFFIDAAGGDDDLCGFVIGWNPGDSTNPTPDYLLFDWKKTTQTFQDWGTALAGTAVSRVTGPFTRGYGGGPRDLWSHTGNCAQLARGNVFGATGWNHDTNYNFRIVFTATTLDIWINGNQEFSLAGTFNVNGRFACYQYSQHGTSFQFPLAGAFTSYGTACRGSGGTPYLFSPNVPYLGQDLPIIIANVGAASVPLLFVGASNASWNGIPLPLDLTAAGAPGCSLLASGQILLPVGNYNGTGYIALPIPGNLPAGTRLFVQCMNLDLAANQLGLVFSNGGDATLGVR